MTVHQLIKELQKMPQHCKVIFVCSDVMNSGAYDVDMVEDYEDGTVVIDSNYKKNYWEDDE